MSVHEHFAEVTSSLSLVVRCEYRGGILGEMWLETLAEGYVRVKLLERPNRGRRFLLVVLHHL